MIEHRFDDRLAVVERAVHGDVTNIRRDDAGHHPPLHVTDAAFRMQNDNIDSRAGLQRFNRRGPGVARSRDNNRQGFIAPFERYIEHAPQHLHGEILERQRRPVKQFQNIVFVADLPQRRDCGVIKAAIGFRRHRL